MSQSLTKYDNYTNLKTPKQNQKKIYKRKAEGRLALLYHTHCLSLSQKNTVPYKNQKNIITIKTYKKHNFYSCTLYFLDTVVSIYLKHRTEVSSM